MAKRPFLETCISYCFVLYFWNTGHPKRTPRQTRRLPRGLQRASKRLSKKVYYLSIRDPGQEASRWRRDGARGRQNGAKRAQVGPKNCPDAPGWHQGGPRWSEEGPKMAPRLPKMAQDVTKMAPRWPQDGSERGLGRRKWEPRHPHIAKTAQIVPRWRQERPSQSQYKTAQDRSKANPRQHKIRQKGRRTNAQDSPRQQKTRSRS